MTNFQVWLSQALKKAGLTQGGLKPLGGPSQSSVSLVMLGRVEPSVNFCYQVAKVLQLDPDLVLAEAGHIAKQTLNDDVKEDQELDPVSSQFDRWVQEEMTARGWKLQDLAKAATVDINILLAIFGGEQPPAPSIILNIAKAFQKPPEVAFRKAGLLPEISDEENMTLSEIYEVVKLIPPQERPRLLRYLYWLVQDIEDDKSED